MTKDERFLVVLYQKVEGDLSKHCDPNVIAETLGFRERLIKNILNGLMQANFVTRDSSGEIGLTKRGLVLAESLTST